MNLEVFDFDHPASWQRVRAVVNEPLAVRALRAGMNARCQELARQWTPELGPWQLVDEKHPEWRGLQTCSPASDSPDWYRIYGHPHAIAPWCAAIGRLLYVVYGPACHQLPERSLFLFGSKTTYTLDEFHALGLLQDADLLERKQFLGNDRLGFKIAFCQRDFALYGGLWIGGLIFGLVRKRLKPLPPTARGQPVLLKTCLSQPSMRKRTCRLLLRPWRKTLQLMFSPWRLPSLPRMKTTLNPKKTFTPTRSVSMTPSIFIRRPWNIGIRPSQIRR